MGQNMTDILIGFEVIGPSRFDEAIVGGTGMSSSGSITEQPVAAPHCERPDGIFSQRITDL